MESVVPWITREQWGAKKPYTGFMKLHPLRTPVVHFNLTTTDTERCSKTKCQRILKELQNYQMNQLEYPDIQYNFLVGGNGKIYEGRGIKYEPGRPGDKCGMPGQCIDVAFIGEFGLKHNDDPKSHMLDAAETLRRYLIEIGVLIAKPVLISFMRIRRYKKEIDLPGTVKQNPNKPVSIKSRRIKKVTEN